jgi:hypothetical protein
MDLTRCTPVLVILVSDIEAVVVWGAIIRLLQLLRACFQLPVTVRIASRIMSTTAVGAVTLGV